MRIKKIVLVGWLFVICSGCASTSPRLHPISIPSLNTESTASLGDRLLVQATGFYANSVVLGSAEGIQTRISAGKYCQFKNDSDLFYSLHDKAVEMINGYGITVNYQNHIKYDKQKNEVCASMFSCYSASEINIMYTSNDLCVTKNSFQQVIEYNGKSNGVLNFTYREFTQDMVRASFTTNFTMDLSEGNIIGYKGAQFKVISATNRSINYMIISNFNSVSQ